MRANRPDTDPDPFYIPDELLRTYGREARLQVASSARGRLVTGAPAGARRAPVVDTHRVVRLAVYSGLATWAVLVAVWGVLAVREPAVWTPIALVGALVLALAAAGLPRALAALGRAFPRVDPTLRGRG